MHDILLLRISAILPEAISDGGLTPTTDTDLLLATYRGGSHLTSDINYFIKAIIFLFSLVSGNIYYILYVFILIYFIGKHPQKNTGLRIRYRFLFRFVRLFASIHDMSISCLFFIPISNVSRETLEIIIFHRQTSFSSEFCVKTLHLSPPVFHLSRTLFLPEPAYPSQHTVHLVFFT